MKRQTKPAYMHTGLATEYCSELHYLMIMNHYNHLALNDFWIVVCYNDFLLMYACTCQRHLLGVSSPGVHQHSLLGYSA